MSIHIRLSNFRRAANLNLVLMLAIAAGDAPMAWGESLDFAPPRPEGPAKIQSSLWDLATAGQAAAKPGARAWEEPVVVTLVPYLGKGFGFDRHVVHGGSGGQGAGAVEEPDAGCGAGAVAAGGLGTARGPVRPQADPAAGAGGDLERGRVAHQGL